MGISTQQTLNDLFLSDIYDRLREKDFDAAEAVARLRLYIAVTGYEKGLRELFLEGGFSAKDYNALLVKYNKQIAKKI